MEYFAIQVWTGHEDEYAQRLSNLPEFKSAGVIVPKRTLSLRRHGVIKKEVKPLFAGYVFVPVDGDSLSPQQRWELKSTLYYMRLLPEPSTPKPIGQRDRMILSHFMSFGKSADTSRVLFDENDRIVVLEGPLKGLEGMIIKVDKRKKRAKVRLDMCQNSFLIDLAFEVMEQPAKKAEAGDEPS